MHLTIENKVRLVCRFLDEAYNRGNLEMWDVLFVPEGIFHTTGAGVGRIDRWKSFVATV